MPTAADLMKNKQEKGAPTEVLSVSPAASALDAARVMNHHHIGAVPVVTESGDLTGMFTERDMLTRVVAPERVPHETPVSEVMSSPVAVCRPETTIAEIRQVMREKRIRHLPVVNDRGALVGMISIGDVNFAEVKVMNETIVYLERYMYKP